MKKFRSQLWDKLFDAPGLLATMNELPGYVFPERARAVLCQQYGLSGEELEDMRCLHKKLRHFGQRPGRALANLRDGWDLLINLPKLRELLNQEREAPQLDAVTLLRRREKFRLAKAEYVKLLTAYDEAHARP